MKVIFRVDSSEKIGNGHLMRCLVLANHLQNRGNEVIFICRDLIGNLINQIKYPVLTLHPNNHSKELFSVSENQDVIDTIKVIPNDTDLVVIDSYTINKLWHKKIRPFTKKIMVIDDLSDRSFDCDYLLNQNLGASPYFYENKVPKNCQFFLGCKYALLRKEFENLREESLIKRKNTSKIKNILISMGGIDRTNKTYEVLKDLPDFFNIVVVLGKHSLHNQMILNYAANKKNIEVIIDANNMSNLMFHADLAIGAGGSSSWERCCLGLPSLVYVLAENQRLIAQNLEQLGAVKIVDNLWDNLNNILNEFSVWQYMSMKAQSICDGRGVKRINI